MYKILKEIYSTSPYLKYKNQTEFNLTTDGRDTYGEITQKGTDDLVRHFKKHFNNNTVFYDLGSGLGKMVLHIGLQYDIKKSIGIELSKERYQGAIDLKEKYAKNNTNIQFHLKSFLDYNLSDATVIYMDNTCMSHEMNEIIYNKLPKGCLLLYKKCFDVAFIPQNKQNQIKDLVDRTYNQKNITWLIK